VFEEENNRTEIIRNDTYLSPEYVPDKPVGRDREIDKIVNALRPVTNRNRPENLLIHGEAGIGKTTCVEYVFKHLEQETRVKTVSMNCWQYNSRSSLLTELLIQVGYPAPRKGKPVDELLSKIREWVEKNRSIAISLDEFDQLDHQTQVIYDLQMLNHEVDNQVGIVMISNQQPEEIQLDPRSESRLNYQKLHFKPYTKDDILEILKSRAEKALHPGTIEEDVLEGIAESVADEDGDCREALSKLLRAARKAESNGNKRVRI
jgi:cell division control protein 6